MFVILFRTNVTPPLFLDSSPALRYAVFDMSAPSSPATFYLLDKAQGMTLGPFSRLDLQAGLDDKRWPADTPVTQSDAKAWCLLSDLLAADASASLDDVLASQQPLGLLSRLMRKFFSK